MTRLPWQTERVTKRGMSDCSLDLLAIDIVLLEEVN